jgi:predicted MFS family arabinose efflux permease
MGQFALFTYVRPFLETVTHVSASGLSLILLAIGIAGFVGTLLVTLVLNAAFYLTLIAIPLLMAAIAGALILTGHNVWIVALLSGLWECWRRQHRRAGGRGSPERYRRMPKRAEG